MNSVTANLPLIFYILLLVVSFLYASVGHGGASGYLALMALFSIAPAIMKPTALILNIFVSVIAFFQFYRTIPFRWKLMLLLISLSIPAAYIGGTILLDTHLYKKILGIVLIIPIIRFAGFASKEAAELKDFNIAGAIIIGAAIGFLSGLIGIGGGIILTPVLLLLGWTNMKEAAGISALFIAVNSIAGLLGNTSVGISDNHQLMILVTITLVGGTAGSFLGARYFSGTILKRILALVLVIAAVKLLLT